MNSIKHFLAKLVNTRLGSLVVDGTVVRASNFVWLARNEAIEQAARNVFADQAVLNGIFKGMKYPSMEAHGSQLYPKLLGSYECELEPLFANLLQNNYTEIIDIGCAEGYYAVGLALRAPNAKVYAFDINPRARQQCHEMAALNGVSSRVSVGADINSGLLKSFPFTGKGLVISDCEGFEKHLFDTDVAKALAKCDLIIEAHDFLDLEITPFLKRVFSSTHALTIYQSTDDTQKLRMYDFPELEGLPLHVKRYFLAEIRPSIMNWLHFCPRSFFEADA